MIGTRYVFIYIYIEREKNCKLIFFKFGHDFVIIYIVVFGFQYIKWSSFNSFNEVLLWYVFKAIWRFIPFLCANKRGALSPCISGLTGWCVYLFLSMFLPFPIHLDFPFRAKYWVREGAETQCRRISYWSSKPLYCRYRRVRRWFS